MKEDFSDMINPFETKEIQQEDFSDMVNPFEKREEDFSDMVNPFETKKEASKFGPYIDEYKVPEESKEKSKIQTEVEPKQNNLSSLYYRGAEMTPEQKQKVSKDLQDIESDIKRLSFTTAKNLTEGVRNHFAKKMYPKGVTPEQKRKIDNILTETILDSVIPFNINWDSPDVVDEEGRIQPIETLTGTGLQLGTLVYGSKKFADGFKFVGKKLKNLKRNNYIPEPVTKVTPLVLGGETAVQLFTDPEYNSFNALRDYLRDSDDVVDGEEGLLDLLSANKDDTDFQKRTKLFVEGLGFSALVGSLGVISKSGRQFVFGKRPEEMTEQEARESLKKYITDRKESLKETDKGIKQIIDQTTGDKTRLKQALSKIVQFKQQFFTSRGYATPLMHKALLNSQHQQRQLITRAENIGLRLNKAISRAGDDKGLVKKINRLLESDISGIYAVAPEKRVNFFAKQRKLPTDVAEEILNARIEIDLLSSKILETPGFSKEVKQTIQENLGGYIRRNYRAFEDAGYQPNKVVKDRATKYIADGIVSDAIQELETNKILVTDVKRLKIQEKAVKEAEKEVDKILGKGDDLVDYTSQMRRVGKFHQKDQTLPKEIRDLLGEIKNPADNIIISLSKATRILETQNFYNTINSLGKRKFIFGSQTDARKLGNRYNTQIKGTNNKFLDGKYTTPEVAKFLNRDEEYLIKGGFVGNLIDSRGYRFYIGLKGLTQSLKTTYSHVTHARNFIGGYQFGLANGRILNHLDYDAFKNLKNHIGRKGDKVLQDAYEEYLGLGVINTSVNVNQFREMLKTGFKDFEATPTYSKTENFRKSKSFDTLINKPQEIYMATDDFFKIGAYEAELKTLKEAFPNMDESILKKEAASIVRNTMPTYDMIPNKIKALRSMPFGNFVAFPAEITRTSFHILKQAGKEINSDNAILKQRGQERLAGFVTAQVGFAGLAKLSHNAMGFDDQDIEDRRLLASGPFSSGHDKIYTRDSNGDVYALDTQYINSYYTNIGPIYAAYDRIQKGLLKGEELDVFLGKEVLMAGIKEFTKPYVSQSIATGPIESLVSAYLSDTGRDFQGRKIFTDKRVEWNNILKEIKRAFLPGTAISVERLYDAEAGIPNSYTLEYRDPFYERIAQTGFKFNRENPDDIANGFKSFVRDYKSLSSKINLDRFNNSTEFSNAEADYFLTNAKKTQIEADLYIAIKASIRQLGDNKTKNILLEEGIPKKNVNRLMEGRFTPIKYPSTTRENVNKIISKLKTSEERQQLEEAFLTTENMQSEYDDILRTILLDDVGAFDFDSKEFKRDKTFEEELEETSNIERTRKNIGGEVFTVIPNAPTEPDERVNKLTGLPYNETAGTAYMDFDDPVRPLSMSKGGKVLKVLKRKCA